MRFLEATVRTGVAFVGHSFKAAFPDGTLVVGIIYTTARLATATPVIVRVEEDRGNGRLVVARFGMAEAGPFVPIVNDTVLRVIFRILRLDR